MLILFVVEHIYNYFKFLLLKFEGFILEDDSSGSTNSVRTKGKWKEYNAWAKALILHCMYDDRWRLWNYERDNDAA